MAKHPLNPAQSMAVAHRNGPLLVLAGAGSGKTRVITHRIAKLIDSGIPARAILALTFTNKAAAEMRERIASVLADQGAGALAKELTISTFHAFGLQVMRRERTALGGVFTIFDQGDALSTIKEVLRALRASKTYDASAILARISSAKNAFLSPEELPERPGDEYDEITKLVFPRYQSALRQFRAFDFDDLVCEVARLFRERQDVLSRWQDRYTHLLVDEYQDTNRAQLELLRLLADRHKNLCVVGDDDQSIYAWRGADVRNILEFEEHFPNAQVVKLEQNYRSTAPVLHVANAVISKRTDAKYKKTLFTEQPGGSPVQLCTATTPEVEAQFVASEIKRQMRDEGRKPKDFAVLYRSNGQAKLIEEALREAGVPHRVVGGQQFFERKEVKDVLAYLKVVVNANDEISLRRIINYPARGIGETSVERLATHAQAHGWSLWQAVERVDALDGIPTGARAGCRMLESLIQDARRDLLIHKKKPSEMVRTLCERMALKEDIDESSGKSGQVAARRWGNVESLLRTFARRDEKRLQAGAEVSHAGDFAAFVQMLMLDFGSETEEGDPNVVILSTLHASKGLEFDVVFMVGCEEGLLPHTRTLEERTTDAMPQDIEEERRLFYVGVTRARKQLFLSKAKQRVARGKPAQRTPSRFLDDIPKDLLEEREIKGLKAPDAASLQAQAEALLAALDSLGG